MDVEVNEFTRSATRTGAGTFELNCERDEWTELVDENADTVDGLRFGRQTCRLLEILFAIRYETSAARQSHLQLGLMALDNRIELNQFFQRGTRKISL